MRVRHVATGPPGHGVVRHAEALVRLQREAGLTADLDGLTEPDVVHVQFSDSLHPGTAQDAADAFARWAAEQTAPVVVTLHDVPGHDLDPARDARRGPAYLQVARLVDAVVVGAPHELAGAGPGAVLVPLPAEQLPSPGPRPSWADRPTVGVLGFIYPGKGHRQALAAAGDARVVALGAASPGHEDLLLDLRRDAERLGTDLVVTGPLSGADLHAGALAVTVPVAAYRTLGASGSLVTWATCRRRPVVTPSPLVQGLLAGSVVVADDLGDAVQKALRQPSTTWLDEAPARVDVVGAHLAVYERVLR